MVRMPDSILTRNVLIGVYGGWDHACSPLGEHYFNPSRFKGNEQREPKETHAFKLRKDDRKKSEMNRQQGHYNAPESRVTPLPPIVFDRVIAI